MHLKKPFMRFAAFPAGLLASNLLFAAPPLAIFFALGILATICVAVIAFGFRDKARSIREAN